MKTIIAIITLSFSLAATPPDCQQTWRFSNRTGDQAIAPMQQFTNIGAGGLGTTGTLDNRYTQCNSWYVSYDNEGFSGLSVLFQSAPAGNGAAGSFVTFAGTTLTGSNPSTVTTSASFSASGYYPYLQTTISAIVGTGSINLTVYGWKSPLFAGQLNTPKIIGNLTTTGSITAGSNIIANAGIISTNGWAQMNSAANTFQTYNGGGFCWSSTAVPSGAQDTCFWRNAAGIVAVGNGTAGNTGGKLAFDGGIVTGGKTCTINTTTGVWSCV